MHRPSLFCRSIISSIFRFVNDYFRGIFNFLCIDGTYAGKAMSAQIKEVHIMDNKNFKNAKDTQNAQNTQNTQNAQNAQNAKNTKNARNAKDSKDCH